MNKINPVLLPVYKYFRHEIAEIQRKIVPLQAHIEFTIKEIEEQNPDLQER